MWISKIILFANIPFQSLFDHFSCVLNYIFKLFYFLFHLVWIILHICRFFFYLLKGKYPCHLKHVCKVINGLLSYDLCYIVMMWCINLHEIIKTHQNIFKTEMKNIKEEHWRESYILSFLVSSLNLSIISFHIIMHT